MHLPSTRASRLLLSGAVAASVLLAAPASAYAATSLESSSAAAAGATAKGHKVHYPTREAKTAPVSRSTLRYGGGVDGIGVTIGTPKVYLIFWGTQWGTQGTATDGSLTFSGDPSGAAPYLQRLFKGVGTNGERWSNVMAQYCEGVAARATTCPASAPHVGYPTGGALAGVWYDNASAMPSSATDHQLAVEAVAAATHFGNTTPAQNRSVQYVVLSATGTHPGGFGTAAANWCAWHDWNGDTTLVGGAASSTVGDIAFTNMPYVLDLGASCGKGYVNGAAGALDGFSIVEGHEYAETITDQNPAGGWTSSNGSENADLCAWKGVGGLGGAGNLATATGSFPMQGTWSNLDNGCRLVR